MKQTRFAAEGELVYFLGKWDEQERLTKEFELSLGRTVRERIQRGWIKTYKPVMDDAPYRIFDRMGDYKLWCERELPVWLGYGKAKSASGRREIPGGCH